MMISCRQLEPLALVEAQSLFERIENSFGRLETFFGFPSTAATTVIFVNAMVEMLFVLRRLSKGKRVN